MSHFRPSRPGPGRTVGALRRRKPEPSPRPGANAAFPSVAEAVPGSRSDGCPCIRRGRINSFSQSAAINRPAPRRNGRRGPARGRAIRGRLSAWNRPFQAVTEKPVPPLGRGKRRAAPRSVSIRGGRPAPAFAVWSGFPPSRRTTAFRVGTRALQMR